MCKCCTIAKGFTGYNWFNPACLYCGARKIQFLGTLRISVTDCTRRRRESLAVWLEYGHAEDELRALAKGMHCTGPEKEEILDLPSLKKLRSRKRK